MASTNLSFDDMMYLPLDLSPLPLSRHSSPNARATITEPPPSPSPNSHPLQRKRPAEDMSQSAGEVSRAHKLVKPDHDKLVEFAQSGHAEQILLLAGQLLALGHHQRQLQPADVPFFLSKRLQARIDNHASIVIADPSIPAYRDDKIGPNKLLTAEKDAKDALNTSISKALISKRNIIKTAICSSLGSDLVDGSTLRPGALNIAQLSSHILSKLKVTMKVDLRLCGRIAVLRKLVVEQNDNKYWGLSIRNLSASVTNTPNQSRLIKQWMLDPDMAVYGAVDLNTLARTPSVPATDPSTVASRSGGGRAADDDDE
ncbi:hypothetical protein C8R44DRAFT_742760 [Mycena epipterygia]|nr:hypothetical protein C8R44DRAFT_742760 [Mycena epipterygia]